MPGNLSFSRGFRQHPLTLACLLLAAVVVFQANVTARFINLWTFAKLAKEAEVLVVGEVLAVATTGKIEAKDGHWLMPLLKKTATVRAIRVSPDPNKDLATGEQFEIDYFNEDPDRHGEFGAYINGPTFPNLSPGDVRIFPLRKGKDNRWVMPDEEDNNLLIPAVIDVVKVKDGVDPKVLAGLISQLGAQEFEQREHARIQLLTQGQAVLKALKAETERATDAEVRDSLVRVIDALGGGSRIGFLRAEYANALVMGDVSTRYRVAGWWGLDVDEAASIDSHLARALGTDTNRWMQILVALFAEAYSRDLTLAEWAENGHKDPDRFDGRRKLAGLVWKRVSKERLDEQIITQALVPGVPERARVTLLKANKLVDHPLTNKLLLAALQTGRMEALSLAFQLSPARARIDPLAVAAVESACKLIQTNQVLDEKDLRVVCDIIRDWGQDQDCRVLLEEFKKAQKDNQRKYRAMWSWCHFYSDRNTRYIPFCAVVLNGQSLQEKGDPRDGDMAVYYLQRKTGQDFGQLGNGKQFLEDRNAAIEKAKAWLGKQPSGFGEEGERR